MRWPNGNGQRERPVFQTIERGKTILNGPSGERVFGGNIQAAISFTLADSDTALNLFAVTDLLHLFLRHAIAAVQRIRPVGAFVKVS